LEQQEKEKRKREKNNQLGIVLDFLKDKSSPKTLKAFKPEELEKKIKSIKSNPLVDVIKLDELTNGKTKKEKIENIINYLSNLLGVEKPVQQLPKPVVQQESIQTQMMMPVIEAPVIREEISQEIIEKQEQEEEKVSSVVREKYTGNQKDQQRALEAEQKRTFMLQGFQTERREREQAINFLMQCSEYSFKDDQNGMKKLEKLGLNDATMELIQNFYQCRSDYDSLVKILNELGCSGSSQKGGSSHLHVKTEFVGGIDIWKPHGRGDFNYTAYEISHFLVPKINKILGSLFLKYDIE
jgi:hypothetical protein